MSDVYVLDPTDEPSITLVPLNVPERLSCSVKSKNVTPSAVRKFDGTKLSCW